MSSRDPLSVFPSTIAPSKDWLFQMSQMSQMFLSILLLTRSWCLSRKIILHGQKRFLLKIMNRLSTSIIISCWCQRWEELSKDQVFMRNELSIFRLVYVFRFLISVAVLFDSFVDNMKAWKTWIVDHFPPGDRNISWSKVDSWIKLIYWFSADLYSEL